jgi:hypothetical protein
MSTHAIDALLAGIEAGSIPAEVFCPDSVLDATVPNWRFSVHGREPVRAELGRWFADPGHFEDLARSPLPDGELVEFTLTWQERGVPHACHQAHILRLRDGRVAADTAFCGGRWPASLLARMAVAANRTP